METDRATETDTAMETDIARETEQQPEDKVHDHQSRKITNEFAF